MHKRQITTTPYANKTYHPEPTKTPMKRNLAQLAKPDRSKLAKGRKINVQKFPASNVSQLKWKSTSGRNLTQEALDAACSMLSSLTPVQGSQLVNNNPSPSSAPSPRASTQAKEDKRYCAICTPLGKECSGRLAMSSDWDEKDDNTRKKEQEQHEVSPNSIIMLTQILQPPKPYITKYFDNMSSDPPISLSLKDKQQHDIIMAQQELNATV